MKRSRIETDNQCLYPENMDMNPPTQKKPKMGLNWWEKIDLDNIIPFIPGFFIVSYLYSSYETPDDDIPPPLLCGECDGVWVEGHEC